MSHELEGQAQAVPYNRELVSMRYRLPEPKETVVFDISFLLFPAVTKNLVTSWTMCSSAV